MKVLVKCKNVWKIYEDGTQALRGIDLTIRKGESVAILGPSGCGKSTLLHIIGCLDKPTKAKVFIGGKDVSTFSENELAKIRRKKIGFVFQFFYLIPTLNVLENVVLPLVIYGKKDEEKARAVLKSVGLEHRISHKPNELSGGERQRVAIARAIINDPELILADEPTGNLDSKSGKEIIDLLLNLNKKGITLVVVTHDKSIAKRMKRIIYMKDGKIIGEKK
jgi:putative ABC transport system ATP-binding protein